MKVSSIDKSSNVNSKAKIKFNKEALEQLSKTRKTELEKSSKKIGSPQDIILVASKSIENRTLPGLSGGILKTYVNAISYKIKGETGLAFLMNTCEQISAGGAVGISHLSERISNFLKRF